jgi:hypothetical protein
LFLLANGLAAQGCAHQVNDQGHGQQAVEHKGDDGPQHGALRAKRFSQGHEQGDIKPTNHDQIHNFFALVIYVTTN